MSYLVPMVVEQTNRGVETDLLYGVFIDFSGVYAANHRAKIYRSDNCFAFDEFRIGICDFGRVCDFA